MKLFKWIFIIIIFSRFVFINSPYRNHLRPPWTNAWRYRQLLADSYWTGSYMGRTWDDRRGEMRCIRQSALQA